ncbi:MAG: chitin binding peritrophin-A domain-containing protein [Candidatus Thiodiazotropha sp.]
MAPVPFLQQIQPQPQLAQQVPLAQPNTVPQQTPLAQALHVVQEAPGANFCDGKADGFHIEPINCHVYIQCVAGTEYRTSCPAGTAFDDKYGVCDYEENVKRCTVPVRQGING